MPKVQAEVKNIPSVRVDGQTVVEHLMKTAKVPEVEAMGRTGTYGAGEYARVDVPIGDKAGEVQAGDDYSPALAKKYAAKKTQLPEIVLGPDGDVRDGNHRIAAAQIRGDKTIKAYVPVGYPETDGIIQKAEGAKSANSKLSPLPPQPRLPDTGTYPAIKTDDGSIYFDKDFAGKTHVMFAKEQGIPPERIVSGGWIKDGDYEGSERSDAGRWGEQARAKIRAEAKHPGAESVTATGETTPSALKNPKEITPLELKKVDKSEPSDEGYVYHATSQDRAYDIAANGLKKHGPSEFTDQQTWPDGTTEKRNYFTKTAEHTWQFAPEDGKPVLIRTKPDADFKSESTGDIYTKKIIQPNKIEILGADNKWHPISSLREESKAANQTQAGIDALAGKVPSGRISSPAKPPTKGPGIEPVGIHGDDLPRDAKYQDVDFEAPDLQDSGKRVTAESVKKDYAPKSKVGQNASVYKAYIPMEDMPSPRFVKREENFDRDDYQLRGAGSPVKVLVKKNGALQILDGNHRTRVWEEQNKTHAPAWVIDERGPNIENISEDEKAEREENQ